MRDQFGVGNQSDAKAFDTSLCGSIPLELIFGEHPHSYSDNNIYARFPNGRIDAFDGHRILVDFEIKSENYLKSSELSGNEVRKGGTGKIFFNGLQVYDFFFRDPMRACLQAVRYAEILLEHALQIWNPEEKIVGRKVWYDNEPAVVTRLIRDQGCVILEPDGINKFSPKPWQDHDCNDYETSVKIDIVKDQSVWWWRENA